MPSSSLNSSFLLLALGTVVAMLSAHVFMGWIRTAQRLEAWRRWVSLGISALVFATGLCLAIVIGLAGEGLPFPIGFRRITALWLWLGSFAVVLGAATWPTLRPGLPAAIGTGTVLATLTVGLQLGWLSAVGFRPGLVWHEEYVALAWLTLVLGYGGAIALTLPKSHRQRGKESWRVAGAGIMGLATLAGSALVISGTNLPLQVGSVYRRELSASVLALMGGGLWPMVLLLMTVDLELRRRERRKARRRPKHHGNGSAAREAGAAPVPAETPAGATASLPSAQA
jgi:hypothetical protein